MAPLRIAAVSESWLQLSVPIYVLFPSPESCGAGSVSERSTGTLENGLSVPLNPAAVNAGGLNLRGIQLHYKTPYVQSYNFALEYQLSSTSAFQAAYVASLSRHLETFIGSNNQSVLLPPGSNPQNYVPFRDFARGSSYDDTIGNANYHSLQTKYEKRFSKGLTALVAYTFSKTRTDAGDLLSGGGIGGFRAPGIPGWGIQGDYGLAPFDIRHAFSASGTYELPVAKNIRFRTGMPNSCSEIGPRIGF